MSPTHDWYCLPGAAAARVAEFDLQDMQLTPNTRRASVSYALSFCQAGRLLAGSCWGVTMCTVHNQEERSGALLLHRDNAGGS